MRIIAELRHEYARKRTIQFIIEHRFQKDIADGSQSR